VKRSPVSLSDVADWVNLSAAFHRAARGKRTRGDVMAFAANLESELALLREQTLAGAVNVGEFQSFRIRDPKPRLIQAPAFRERVLHHALMAHIGPVIDRTLVFDCYACRDGKGPVAAVKRAQAHARRFSWFCQIDVRSYFASIDHEVLMRALRRRFKNRGLLALMERIVTSAPAAPGRGLPIGALTSQYCANLYLNGLDRLILEQAGARGYVRYMDDLVWWGPSRFAVREILAKARSYAEAELKLEVKTPVRVGQSAHGLCFCGYRILPDRLLLTRRRKQRYAACRRRGELAYARSLISARELQSHYASAYGMTAHADAAVWRREQLARSGLVLETLEV
jgi:RNA-directed DNA polymerase